MTCTLGIDSKVAILPDECDPADIIAQDVQQFKKIIKESVSATTFLTRYVEKQYGESSEDRIRGVKEAILPIIAMNNDSMNREHMTKETAAFCGLSVEVVKENLQQIQESNAAKDIQPKPPYKRKPIITEKDKNAKKKKISDSQNAAATALQFLRNQSIPLTKENEEMLSEVEKYTKLPEVDKKIAQMRYETKSISSDEQVQSAQDELGRPLKYLIAEYRREEELKKLKTAK